MKRIAAFVFTFGLMLGGFLFTRSASAADVYAVTLTSTDAGSTNTGSLTAQKQYVIQCALPSCYKTGTATLACNCSQDFMLPLVGDATTGKYQRDFESAGHTKVAARAIDGGNPACTVDVKYTNVKDR